MRTTTFDSPLFIVGRPRSGTKLLRTLLNEHPQVAIPISETNMIPTMVTRFGNPPQLDIAERFDSFYRKFRQTSFFEYRRIDGVILEKSQLAESADLTSWSSIFEAILKFYAPKDVSSDVVWGDKSPSYLSHMLLLKSLFPTARFLHIIRDPRDQCYSAKKAWGKDLRRSAEVWRSEIQRAREVGKQLGSDYKEILFESLLGDPESIVREICEYLELPFDPRMMELSVSHEDRGDAAGELRIVSGNQRKYLEALSPATLKRVEEITLPLATTLGYKAHLAVRYKPLNRLERNMLALQDGLSMTWFYIQDKGIRQGLHYFFHKLSRATAKSLR
ncbi:MAG: sulfotransferase [Trueperaceae bacterium]|nr:MAG: sulfotransferase [Trueperaceae bacterium]